MSHGSVSYVSNTSKCANCGTVLVQFYEECFKLDSSFSKNAAKINDYLSDKASQSGEFMSRTITSTEEECAEHKEWPDHYLETQEFFVNGVEILSGKYLTVNMAGYWYGGGAHGESLRAQYIFNLDTGDYVTLEDLFPGTEEEFKKLIAEKTKEDCEGNIYRYYNPEPDYVYNEAYSFASFYTTRIEFYEDRALLVYAPYDMGPYAAGYIEIPLTYEELLGRPGL